MTAANDGGGCHPHVFHKEDWFGISGAKVAKQIYLTDKFRDNIRNFNHSINFLDGFKIGDKY
jgi:hypothetical protein